MVPKQTVMRICVYVCTCVRREADKDMVVGGYRVPKGTVLSMPPYASQLSPHNFTAPGKFLPGRWFKSSDTPQLFDAGWFVFPRQHCLTVLFL